MMQRYEIRYIISLFLSCILCIRAAITAHSRNLKLNSQTLSGFLKGPSKRYFDCFVSYA